MEYCHLKQKFNGQNQQQNGQFGVSELKDNEKLPNLKNREGKRK